MLGFRRGHRVREMLSPYIDGQLAPDELRVVESHLAACEACREELGALEATVSLVRRIPEVSPPRSFAVVPRRALQPAPRPGWAWGGLRAATAVAASLLVLAFAGDMLHLFPSPAPAPIMAPATAPEAAPAPIMAPALPAVSTLELPPRAGGGSLAPELAPTGEVAVEEGVVREGAAPEAATMPMPAAEAGAGVEVKTLPMPAPTAPALTAAPEAEMAVDEDAVREGAAVEAGAGGEVKTLPAAEALPVAPAPVPSPAPSAAPTAPAPPAALPVPAWVRPVEVFLLALTVILAGITGLVGWRRRGWARRRGEE